MRTCAALIGLYVIKRAAHDGNAPFANRTARTRLKGQHVFEMALTKKKKYKKKIKKQKTKTIIIKSFSSRLATYTQCTQAHAIRARRCIGVRPSGDPLDVIGMSIICLYLYLYINIYIRMYVRLLRMYGSHVLRDRCLIARLPRPAVAPVRSCLARVRTGTENPRDRFYKIYF